MSIVNMESTHNMDHHDEVRKLQNLVRELEVQNQQLRNKQRASNYFLEKHTEQTVENVSKSKNTAQDDSSVESSEEADVIDVSRLNLSPEDSWLYSPPEILTESQKKAVSPYKWMRADVDDPRQLDIQTAKRGLVKQIETLTTASDDSNGIGCKNRIECLEGDDQFITKNAFSTKLLEKLNVEFSPCEDRRRNFDSRTFTRPKKTVVAPLPIVDADSLSTKISTGIISSPNSDVIDIQTLARLQEECLRQSSSPSTPRRNSAGTGTASRTSSNSTSPSMSPFGSQNLDDPISGRLKPKTFRHNGVTSPRTLSGLSQPKQFTQSGCDTSSICDKNTGRIPRYSVSPSPKGGSSSRSGSPAASRLTAPSSYRSSPPPLEDGQHESRANHLSRIPKPRAKTRLPVFTRDSWKDGCY
ncbi:hypothetical protein CHUAL_008629 [Chamberlinius hualienensis]